MASNSWGTIFRITTWGESHGKAIGVVVDGCPAGLALEETDFEPLMARRAPGTHPWVSPRREPDRVAILSGVYEGRTSGAPIQLMIVNQDVASAPYQCVQHTLRPGHAQYTYWRKYGQVDPLGGGRASARETACRVAASVIAHKILQPLGVQIWAHVIQIGPEKADRTPFISTTGTAPPSTLLTSALFVADPMAENRMRDALQMAQAEGDSLGGVVEFVITGCPVGWGDPVYDKLEARLAYAMMGIPASKGFEIGEGFAAAAQRGSEHNDVFEARAGEIALASNRAGGVLGGISTGEPIVGRVAFKPTASIQRPQPSLDWRTGASMPFVWPDGARHDPCVAIRAVPVVEAMCALVLVDAYLMHQALTVQHKSAGENKQKK